MTDTIESTAEQRYFDAFEKIYGRKPNSKPYNIEDNRWRGFVTACKYMQSEIDNITPSHTMARNNHDLIMENKNMLEIHKVAVRLEVENKKLRECVEFYADGNSWKSPDELYIDDYLIGQTGQISVGGRRARQCLKEIEK